MVVATIRAPVPLDNRRELVQTLQSLCPQIRRHQGCLSYHFYFEYGEEDSFCLIEEWDTQSDLDKHLKSGDFAILLGAINVLKGPAEIEFKLLSQTAGIEAVEATQRNVNS